MKKILTLSLVALCAIQLGGVASAAGLFNASDNYVAIDTDSVYDSSSPGSGAEDAVFVRDGNIATKYLNFGGQGTGFIVTPGFGSSVVQSVQMATGNDAPGRDPLQYDLYGTNDPITSTNNGPGDGETWTPITLGALTGLADLYDPMNPNDNVLRGELGTIEDIVNGTSYTSYKMIFPELRDNGNGCCMQVAEVQLYTDLAGGGSGIFGGFDTTLAVTDNPPGSQSSYPGGEAPAFGFDGEAGTKYLNFADTNSGVILSKANGGTTIIDSLTFTTGNDAPGRDPVQYALYGTDDPVTSADNGLGDSETWTLVSTGPTGLGDLVVDMGDEMRGVTGAPQAVANTTEYGAYRIVFTELRGGPGEGIMQVAEILAEGTFVPEPSSMCLALFGLAACCLRKRS